MKHEYKYFVKSCREKAGFTQKEVEAKLGLRSLMIRDYEIGRLKLPVSIAIDLAKLYGVSIDELLGHEVVEDKSVNSLENFKIFFHNNGFEALFTDPVILGALGGVEDQAFSFSIYEILTKNMNTKTKSDLILETSKILSSLAGIDGKVTPSERACVNLILSSFNMKNKVKSVNTFIGEKYIPKDNLKCFEKNEIKHFVIWIMYFFAQADGLIVDQEIKYIDEIALSLKLYRSNYLAIKKKFIEE